MVENNLSGLNLSKKNRMILLRYRCRYEVYVIIFSSKLGKKNKYILLTLEMSMINSLKVSKT